MILSSKRKPERATLPARSGLADSGLLEEAHSGSIPRMTIWAVVLGFFGFLVWASFTPVYEIVSGPGSVRPVGLIQRIDHLDGGVVARVHVSEGQTVREGDLLMELDQASIRAELAKLHVQAADLSRDLRRQRAFLADLEAGLPSGLTVQDESFVSEQASQAAHVAAQIELARAEREVLEAEQDRAAQRLASLKADFSILSAYAARLDTPGARAATTRVRIESVRREVLQKQGEIAGLVGEQEILAARIQQSAARETELLTGFRREAAAQLAETVSTLRIVEQSITQLEGAKTRTFVRAPSDGVLLALGFQNAHQVVPPGALVAELVPLGKDVFAEVEISAERIGTVRPGSAASIKVLSHDFTRFGDLDATVEQVSPSSFVKPDGSTVFRVRLALEESFTLASGAPDPLHEVLPGMTVVADIRTGRKSILSYMLKPLRTLSDRAFSES